MLQRRLLHLLHLLFGLLLGLARLRLRGGLPEELLRPRHLGAELRTFASAPSVEQSQSRPSRASVATAAPHSKKKKKRKKERSSLFSLLFFSLLFFSLFFSLQNLFPSDEEVLVRAVEVLPSNGIELFTRSSTFWSKLSSSGASMQTQPYKVSY